MKRRSKVSRKTINAGSRKAPLKGSSLSRARAKPSVPTIEDTETARLIRERDEALEQQAATREVLRVISSSPGDLQPVFQAVLENAVRLCGARFGILWLVEGDGFRLGSLYGAPAEFSEERRRNPFVVPGPNTALGRTKRTRQLVHIDDVTNDLAYTERDPLRVGMADKAGARTLLSLPMLKDKELVGAIGIYRQEVRPFGDKQIELLKSFAAQAVIAIENARLLNELRQRTDDLGEALEQQTAISDVLQVISSSPADLNPVFEAILDRAVRICKTHFGVLLLFEGGRMRVVAMKNAPPGFAEMRRRDPYIPLEKSVLSSLVRTRRLAHVTDITTEEPYASSPLAKFGGARTALGVPMLREDELVGAIAFYRQEVEPFSEKQIALLRNFAAQAVIAIENARLLNELRESLDQQTATSEVLRVISSSPGDLEPVFTTMLENATRICDAEFGTLFRYDGKMFHRAASVGTPAALVEFQNKRGPFKPETSARLGRLVQTKEVYHTADELNEPEPGPPAKYGGARSVVGVPMLKDNEVVGAIIIYRQEVRPFTEKQIELVKNFAAQAVIAIENTRLLNELRQRTTDLSKSLDSLRTAQDRLVQTQKLASLGQLTAGIAHEIKNPLNFVNNFSGVSVELIDELQEVVKQGAFDDKAQAEVAELTGTLRENLDKIVQHGKRADSIVKNMLLHSREGSGERRSVDVNALVDESLNLAYHGARAEKQGFTITLARSFDPEAGEADVFPQEVTRVLLNLISNGFYAATKRQEEADNNDYEPILTASTRSLGDRIEIRIRDNGTGIPPEVREKMFNPFFTTKPTGEGTGLGLSISHDIVVKQHAGTIEVDTAPGEFTEVKIVLPRMSR
jgi:GAF domain-containing protein